MDCPFEGPLARGQPQTQTAASMMIDWVNPFRNAGLMVGPRDLDAVVWEAGSCFVGISYPLPKDRDAVIGVFGLTGAAGLGPGLGKG